MADRLARWQPELVLSVTQGVQPRAQMTTDKNGHWYEKSAVDKQLSKIYELQKLVEIYRPCQECGHSKAAHCNLLFQDQWACSTCLCGFYAPDLSCEIEAPR